MKDSLINWQQILEPIGTIKKFSKGQLLFSIGQKAQTCFCVISGSVRIYKLGKKANEIDIRMAEKGDLFAEVVVLADYFYPNYAEVVQDCQLLCVDRLELQKLVASNIEVSRLFVGLLAKRCMFMNQKIEHLTLEDLQVRFAYYLVEQIKEIGFPDPSEILIIELGVKKNIANRLGTTPESISRTLKKFSDLGIIKVDRDKVFVTDFNKLHGMI